MPPFFCRIILRFCLPILVALPVVSLWAGNANAANQQAQEKAARKACLSGDYATGVAMLSDLFVETRLTTYIFNQGRCFEQNRRYEDAIARFQEYLRAGRDQLDNNDRAETEKHIADCKQMLAQERALNPVKVSPEPSVPPPPLPPLKAEVSPEPVETIAKSPLDPPTAAKGTGWRTGGIVTAAIGAASLGAGLLLNLKANSTVDTMYKSLDGYTKDSDRKTYTTFAWVGYGIGAACLATGVALYLVGSADGSSPTLALAPRVGTDQTGLTLSGAF